MLIKPKVSIIIPMYNASKYFDELIDCFVNQTYSNIEVFLINDGSTDDTYEKIKNAAKKDSRIIPLTQENKGPGAARNQGIDNATGKYLYFADSDDLLDKDAIEILVKSMRKYKADMINFNADVFYDGVNEEDTIIKTDRYIKKNEYPGIYDGCKYFEEQLQKGDASVVVWSYFFKMKTVKDIRFLATRCHDDTLYTCECFVNSKKVKFIDNCLYHRRVRHGSLMTKKADIAGAYAYYRLYYGFDKIKDASEIMGMFKQNQYNDTQITLDKVDIDELEKEYANEQYELDFREMIKDAIDRRKAGTVYKA